MRRANPAAVGALQRARLLWQNGFANGNLVVDHARLFANRGAGIGKTKRVAADGVSDARNDIMLYSVVEADSHEAAARLFDGHAHLGNPKASVDGAASLARDGRRSGCQVH